MRYTRIQGFLREFTGLLDKNGKEIYEGDIVKDFSQQEKIYPIFLCEECAGFSDHEMKLHGKTNVFIPFASVAKEAIEVIGNIYENPELLEK